MKIKISDYIAKTILTHNITQVFSVTGGGAMHLNDALGHQPGLTTIYNHHEQACAMAAECYARINRKLAALCVTTGPGGTNAITGVLGSWLDSIPMLVLSGQVRYDTTARSTGLDIRALGDQEFDITKSISCMTKYSEMVIDPLRIRFCLEKAVYLAQTGRPGPCWLDIPLNVQGAYVEEEDLIGFNPDHYHSGGTGWAEASASEIPSDTAGRGERRELLPPLVTEETAKTIIDKIRSAKRPVINAGNGIRIAGAYELFIKVAEKLGIPVVTGWNSIDCIYDRHPLYTGRAGGMGDRAGNFAVQNSDLLLSIGSRLSIRQVGYNYETWAREAYVIVNDIDMEELKKPTLHIDMPVHADAKQLLEQLLKVLESEEPELKPSLCPSATADYTTTGKELSTHCPDWVRKCQSWKKHYPVVMPKHYKAGDTEAANVYAFIKELSGSLQDNQISVVGNGSACVVGGHAYVMKPGQRFISNSAIASMGYDLPAAIGAWAALKEEQKKTAFAQSGITARERLGRALDGASGPKGIVLVTGDGSIQMNLQELQTIIHHRMDIKIFLINNGGYHSIRQTQTNMFGEPLVGIGVDSGDLSFPEMDKLAAAYGYPYKAAHHNSELIGAIEWTLAQAGPVICEVFVSRDQNFEPKSSAKRLPDGTLISPPLEDLSPFLSREEMTKNMIIPMLPEQE